MQIDPRARHAYSNLAWVLATCSDAALRDGRQAVADATKACELSQWANAWRIAALAAAYAEVENFNSAIKWQTKALGMAPDRQKARFQSRLDLYPAGTPYRDGE